MFEQPKTIWTGYVWSAIKRIDDGFVKVTFKPKPRSDISFKIKNEDLSDLVIMLTCAEESVEGGCFTLYDDGTLCINDPKDVSSALCEVKTYGAEYEGGGRR